MTACKIFIRFKINCLFFTLCIVLVYVFSESDITKERIQKIIAAGANVILTTGGIDDLCLKYFVESGAMAVRRCKKADLKRIAKATGGKICNSGFYCEYPGICGQYLCFISRNLKFPYWLSRFGRSVSTRFVQYIQIQPAKRCEMTSEDTEAINNLF